MEIIIYHFFRRVLGLWVLETWVIIHDGKRNISHRLKETLSSTSTPLSARARPQSRIKDLDRALDRDAPTSCLPESPHPGIWSPVSHPYFPVKSTSFSGGDQVSFYSCFCKSSHRNFPDYFKLCNLKLELESVSWLFISFLLVSVGVNCWLLT